MGLATRYSLMVRKRSGAVSNHEDIILETRPAGRSQDEEFHNFGKHSENLLRVIQKRSSRAQQKGSTEMRMYDRSERTIIG